jgi:short subunit dehydrogenase-like uncharacterized protein
MHTREFDVLLYGATGFVGRQTVAYFARHAPADLRWAIAGRNQQKLQALEANVPILTFDSLNQAEVDIVVARTRIILSTAGPFRLYSDPIVDACVRLGTHYIDISGETARIRDLIDRCHAAASDAHIRIVPLCAFISAPADLAVDLLDRSLNGQLVEAKGYFQMGGGSFNGGSISSIAYGHATGDVERERDLFLLSPSLRRPPVPLEEDPNGIHYDRTVGAWTSPAPMGISDTRTIRRSSELKGKEIVYQEYMAYPGSLGALKALGFHAVISILNALMRRGATRRFLQKRIPPGTGPTEKAMDASWFLLRTFGRTADGVRAEVSLSGDGDAGNRVTVKCVCEGAMAMVLDEASLPNTYGVLTPSAAFGDVLALRLEGVGIEIKLNSALIS